MGTGRIGERTPCVAALDLRSRWWRRIETTGPTPACIGDTFTYFDAEPYGDVLVAASQDGIYSFSFSESRWKELYRAPLPSNLWSNYHATLRGQELYLFGWSDAFLAYRDSDEPEPSPSSLHMHKFNLHTGVWSNVVYFGTPPSPRERSTACQIDDKWVVHGGISGVLTSDSLSDTYVFNFTSRVWDRVACGRHRPSPRGNHAAARMGKHHIAHVGGRVNWHGQNRALSTPCVAVECLRLVTPSEDAMPSVGADEDLGALMVMSDTQTTSLLHPLRRKLFKSRHLSDVELVVEGLALPCHRLVLAEASAVFRGMWASDMADSHSERVELSGVRADVMEVLLRYMYCCLEEVPAEMAVEVFQAADRFGPTSTPTTWSSTGCWARRTAAPSCASGARSSRQSTCRRWLPARSCAPSKTPTPPPRAPS
ncbi:unnamed protein product [Ostreobium quekettii]|uniref:BTB domain-containing protein n=1 Tax=Ostreobium quekettii TaxID=121088 RepID=A0A8S1J1Y6_9CHLO|nr:unnamed protein product [Ostreobium quekettii]